MVGPVYRGASASHWRATYCGTQYPSDDDIQDERWNGGYQDYKESSPSRGIVQALAHGHHHCGKSPEEHHETYQPSHNRQESEDVKKTWGLGKFRTTRQLPQSAWVVAVLRMGTFDMIPSRWGMRQNGRPGRRYSSSIFPWLAPTPMVLEPLRSLWILRRLRLDYHLSPPLQAPVVDVGMNDGVAQ